MVNTLLIYVRDRLVDNSVLFTYFHLLRKEKNRNLTCISSKQEILWHLTHNFSVNNLTKGTPFGKMDC